VIRFSSVALSRLYPSRGEIVDLLTILVGLRLDLGETEAVGKIVAAEKIDGAGGKIFIRGA
jgi:hypothetical protein